MLPTLSAPLKKDIRTGEGIFEWLTAVFIGVATTLPHGLTWTQGGTFLTIVAAIKGARRLILKATALQSAVGLDAPIPFAPEKNDLFQRALTEIRATQDAVKVIQNEPGTPAESVVAAGAPGETAPAVVPAPAPKV